MTFPLKDSPTVVAFAGDWHANERHAVRAIDYAHDLGAEGIVHLGDFGVWPSKEGQKFLKAVSDRLVEHRMWLGFVDGNHEDFRYLAGLRGEQEYPVLSDHPKEILPRVTHLTRGMRWSWHGQTWMSLGGATSLDKVYRAEGRDWFRDEAITYVQAKKAVKGGPVRVMIAHDCPASVDVPNIPPRSSWRPDALAVSDAHRSLLQQVVDEVQPQLYFHGHFHSAYTKNVDGTAYVGLDCDGGELPDNVKVFNITDLQWSEKQEPIA
jgi:predicted phosphodiesterase